MSLHSERARRITSLSRLDPAIDWHDIYRRLSLWELPAEARFGFQLAFYRPLAVPRMARVFHRTGHVQHHTTRRAYDTGIIIHEIIWGGVDSDRGQRMVKLMNTLHRRRDIHPDDMTYVLNALIVVPTRFMDRHGWRTVSPAERAATWRFYDALGERMTITGRATSYPHAEEQLDAYEAEHLAPSLEGTVLTEAVVAALRSRLPRPARRFAAQITSALIDDPRVSHALSLPAPGPALTGLLTAGTAARRHLERRRAPSAQPSFWPGRPAGTIYPGGYTLDQLGPAGV